MNRTRRAFALALVTLIAPAARALGWSDDTCLQATPTAPGLHGPDWTEESYSVSHPSWNYADADWYRVTVQPGQELRITPSVLAYAGEPGELTTRLFAGPCPGSPISFQFGEEPSLVRNTTSQPIDYLFLAQAFVWDEGLCRVQYSLLVEVGFTVGCGLVPEDSFEVGPGVPVPIAPGTYHGLFASTDNADEYTLRLPAGASIRAQIDFLPEQGDLDLEVRDAAVTLQSNGFLGQESIVYATTPPDAFRDVFVRVAPKTGLTSVCNTYSLTLDVLQSLGTNYCLAGVNGYGTGATILGAGSTSVSANALSFVAQAFPGGNPGILIAGSTQTQIPFGDGFRCVGGTILRLGASSANQGVATYPLNFASPQGSLLTPGTTWNFQVYYRDLTLPGGTGFNLSDAVSIPLTP